LAEEDHYSQFHDFNSSCQVCREGQPLNGPAAGGKSTGRGRGLLRPEGIDNFRKIGTGPDVAASVVEGLRAADEKGELEPALMRIIREVDETPHGPTEIADIRAGRRDHGRADDFGRGTQTGAVDFVR
jgi:hypothetical protein